MQRLCPACGKPIKQLYARLCSECWKPGLNYKHDEAAKQKRRARGLKGRRYFDWYGKQMYLAEIARSEGVKIDALYRRLGKGDKIHAAVEAARKVS